ncbi:hypothetical protein CWS01_01720 [Niallia nealsonii]|uniref:Uncharacterized protein n=1 Tax=Niallia nealsonii TaxID=115979 RepID=A0A2N0Z7V6_9BACI|nr:hypothetical protein CWS01_01720 [Niallia nealsonii]
MESFEGNNILKVVGIRQLLSAKNQNKSQWEKLVFSTGFVLGTYQTAPTKLSMFLYSNGFYFTHFF